MPKRSSKSANDVLLTLATYARIKGEQTPETSSAVNPAAYMGRCNHALGTADVLPTTSRESSARERVCFVVHYPCAWNFSLGISGSSGDCCGSGVSPHRQLGDGRRTPGQ